MKKILHVTSSLDEGGIAKLLLDYCSRMITDIHFDFAITSEDIGMLESTFEKWGCNVYHIPQFRKHPIQHLKALNIIIKSGQYSIIHEHSDYKSLFTLLIAKKYNVKIRIAHSHLAFVPESKLKKIIRKLSSFLVKKNATHLMACSRDAAVWMWGKNSYNNNQVQILPNAIKVSEFSYDMRIRNKIRKNLGLENKIVVGNVARFAYQKNHNFLLDVFYELVKINDCYHLLLIGDGELRTDIENKIKELGIVNNVTLMGALPNVNNYLNAMDLFFLPSHFEGLGIVYVEAQANGLICFASKDVVPEEVNLCNRVVFISLESSAEQWAKTIARTKIDRIDDSKEMIRLAGYDIDLAAEELKRLYLNL